MANRYRIKSTQGLQAQLFVSSAAEPGDSDFETFVTSGSEGELSAFNAAGTRFAGDATASNAANIQVTDKFFIAQILDGKVKRSQLLDASAVVASSKAAAAGTKHKIVVSAMPDPVLNDPMEITIVETTPTQEPFPTWYYDHRATSTVLYAQLSAIAGYMNDATNKANQSDGVFVNADILTSATGGTFGAGTETLAVVNGSTAMTASADVSGGLAADDWISVAGSLYQIVTIGTTDIVVDRLYAGATDSAVANASLKDQTSTMPTASTLSFEVEAINYNEHFTIVQPAVWVDAPTTVTTTPFVKTSGTAAQVLDLESEGDVWEGYRTGNRAFGEDFGKPTSQVTTGDTYDIYTLKYLTKQKSVMAPIAEDKHVSHVVIAGSHADTKTWLGQVFANL